MGWMLNLGVQVDKLPLPSSATVVWQRRAAAFQLVSSGFALV
jgi:hypothetical protein